LGIQYLFNARFRKYVMISTNALIKTKMKQQIHEIRKWNIGI